MKPSAANGTSPTSPNSPPHETPPDRPGGPGAPTPKAPKASRAHRATAPKRARETQAEESRAAPTAPARPDTVAVERAAEAGEAAQHAPSTDHLDYPDGHPPLGHTEAARAHLSLSATELARALRAVAEVVEHDPDLARRVGEAIAGGERGGEIAAPRSTPPLAPPPTLGEGAGGRGQPSDSPSPRRERGPGGEATLEAGGEATHTLGGEATLEGAEGRGQPLKHRFRPTIITGLPSDLGMGVPDPYALRARLGEEGLRAALEELRLGGLRAIIREHALDPSGRLAGVNDAAKLRARILAATAKPPKGGRATASNAPTTPTSQAPKQTPKRESGRAERRPQADSSRPAPGSATPHVSRSFDIQGEDLL